MPLRVILGSPGSLKSCENKNIKVAASVVSKKTDPTNNLSRLPQGVSNDRKFQGASLLKLPLMVLTFKMSEEGALDLNTKYILKNTDKVKGSGILYTASEGTTYTYRQLVEYMGKYSDRTAYKVMKDVVTEDKMNNFLLNLGATSTDITTGITTPNDLGSIFENLWSGEIINEEDKKELLKFLTNTAYEKWISAGVPKGVSVAHKFGQDDGVVADAGIIEAPKPYILVLMGQGINAHDADTLYPKFSKDVYDAEAGNK